MTSVPKKVIIVEDQPDIADLFGEILSLDGYEVIKFHSSTGAVSVMRTEKPDVVLLDIMMPDVSGLEVLRFMRREPDLQHTPVVIVSARTMAEDIHEGLEAGATVYLSKPVNVETLRETVARVIREAQGPVTDTKGDVK